MEQKQNQRVMLTKRLLKESLIDMLSDGKVLHKLSIRELCTNAGINHCTFYKYYGSQYALLKEIESDLLDKMEKTLVVLDDNNKTDLFILVLRYLEDNIKITRLLVNNIVDTQFTEKLFTLPVIQKHFSYALQDQAISPYYEYITNFLFHGAFRIIQIWINKEKRESPEEMAEILDSVLNKNYIKESM